jgi:ferredoxin--NADP+ reductase
MLAELLEQQEAIDRVFAVGPIPMMRGVADLTHPHNIETSVSLNPIMVDGTGMCGGCRVLIDGVTKFACVDGPEFDAHHVNFDVLEARNRAYRGFELSRAAPAESANS